MDRAIGTVWRRRVVVLLLGVGVGLGALALGLFFFQRSLIYFPLAAVPPVGEVLAGAEEVEFASADGIRLAGWFLKPSGPEPPYRTILVFDGNAGNRSLRAPLAARLGATGFAVLVWDYRGYGGNAGAPSEEGLIRDARAARDYLLGRDDVDPARLVYFGESLGSGVATALAAEESPAALVLRSTFASLVDVARFHYPLLPAGLLLRDRFDSAARIAAVDCPLLILAGDRDRIVPLESSRRLFAAAPAAGRRMVVFEGAGHNDRLWLDGEEMIAVVLDFLGR